MRYLHQLLILFAVLYCVKAFFLRCNDSQDQQKDNASSTVTTNAEDTILINQGKALFKDTCGACHAVLKTDNYLAEIAGRLGTDYLKLYITKQDSLIKVKKEYALEINKSYGNLASVHNYKLSNEQLNAIIAFLKKYSP